MTQDVFKNYRVQYIKIITGESIITWCSKEIIDSDIYLICFPFRYDPLFSEDGKIINTDLVPWVECGNQGPLPLSASNIIMKIDVTPQENQAYQKIVQGAIERNKQNEKNQKSSQDKKRKKMIRKVSDIQGPIKKPSDKIKPPLKLIYDRDEFEKVDG